jgi:RNA polymerase sigma-70 factor (ECF subfamily)
MPNPTDGELMRQIRERSKDALSQLYDRHARLVYSFACRVSGDEALAREIVQLVFTRLWTTRSEFDSGKGAFASWLITMTRNISIDVIRRERRHRAMVPIEEWKDAISSDSPDTPEAVYLNRDRQTTLISASRRLSEPQQQVIELLYWKGYSLQEIAAMSGEPVGTIKSRLHQALKALRRQLQGLREEL